MKALLLAAGKGERFRPWTTQYPKPSIPFLNLPMMYYPAKMLCDFGVQDIIVNCHHLPDKIKSSVKTLPLPAQFSISDESAQLMGSGGALGHARKELHQSDFIYCNSDAVFFTTETDFLKKLEQVHQQEDAIATLLVTHKAGVGTQFGGVWLNNKKEVIGIGKSAPTEATVGLHFCGIQMLSSRIFKYVPEGPCEMWPDIVMPAIRAGEKVRFYQIDSHWFETGSINDYMLAVSQCLQMATHKDYQEQFAEIFEASHSQFEKTNDSALLLHRSSHFGHNIVTSGACVFGAETKIGDHSVLDRVVAGENIHIPANCHLSHELLLR